MLDGIERPTRLVLQVGNVWTRLGLAHEEYPRQLLKLGLRDYARATDNEGDTTNDLSRAEWRDRVNSLLNKAIKGLAEVSLEGAELVLVENPACSIQLRAAILDTLFEDHRVGEIAIVPEMVCPLYCQGVSSGLVLDIGYNATKCLPVAHGTPLFSAYRDTHGLGAKTMIQKLKQSLKAEGETKDRIDPELIMARYCYCRVKKIPTDFYSNEDAIGEDLTIPARVRWETAEALFAPQKYSESKKVQLTPSELIIDCLEAVDAINRPVVLQNVLVTGGPATIAGLRERIAMELAQLLQSNENLKYLWDKYPIKFQQLAGGMGSAATAAYKGAVLHATYFQDLPRIQRDDWNREADVNWSDMWQLNSQSTQRDDAAAAAKKAMQSPPMPRGSSAAK